MKPSSISSYKKAIKGGAAPSTGKKHDDPGFYWFDRGFHSGFEAARHQYSVNIGVSEPIIKHSVHNALLATVTNRLSELSKKHNDLCLKVKQNELFIKALKSSGRTDAAELKTYFITRVKVRE